MTFNTDSHNNEIITLELIMYDMIYGSYFAMIIKTTYLQPLGMHKPRGILIQVNIL